MKDLFSKQAGGYSKYRPAYPAEIFDYILSLTNEKKTAWDCGTGNGQTAAVLAKYFEAVIATDISRQQIDHAVKAGNIIYKLERAEQTSIANNSIDLISVSQALHWFDFEQFYSAVRRVAKPGAVLAAWTYSLLKISPAIDELISDHHFKTLHGYWDEERKFVDNNYADIPFPFPQIQSPDFRIELDWSLEDLDGYLNTWSALQKFIADKGYNPVNDLIKKIMPVWGNDPVRKVVFPIHMKIARL